jgi:hypothetical protein
VDAALIREAAAFHAWDAMAPEALAAIAARAANGGFSATAETGCGGSTIVLSHLSRHHTAFAIEGENRTITALRQHAYLAGGAVTFIEGETRATVPGFQFSSPLDLVLLDGPHAYPWPQVEFAYLAPFLRVGGWLAIDDIQIPSVHELFRFLRGESAFALDQVVVRTAFFRKAKAPLEEPGPDGWWLQGMNKKLVLRYAWRDRLRRAARHAKRAATGS